MTPQQWKTICEKVTNDMLVHTRPFVTPLGTANEWSVRLVGTGSYVSRDARRMLLSCEHVAHNRCITDSTAATMSLSMKGHG